MKNIIINCIKVKYILVLLGALLILIIFNCMVVLPVSNNITEKVIVLDAGHGGEDGGAQTNSGILEKDLNLSITLKVKELLEKEKIKVILTREGDNDLSDCTDTTVKSRKNQDLNKRVEIINNSNANLLVSIHMNSFPQEKYFGWQTFYKKNCVYSSELAKNVQENIGKATNIENKRVAMEINGIKIIEKCTIPAILIECGFLSNKDEAELLNTDEYQNKIAKGIVDGILQWYMN